MSLPDYLDSLFEPPGDTADGAHSARDGPQVVEWERLVEEWERQQ